MDGFFSGAPEAGKLAQDDFDGLLRDVWEIAEPMTSRVVIMPMIKHTVGFWMGLSRWRRFVYWLFPDKGERDLWAYLRAHGVTER